MSCAVSNIYRSLLRLGQAAPPGAADEHQVLARIAMPESCSGCERAPGALGRSLCFGGGGDGLDGLAEEIALHPDRAALRQEFELRGALDSLGHHLQSQAMAERDDGPHDGGGA